VASGARGLSGSVTSTSTSLDAPEQRPALMGPAAGGGRGLRRGLVVGLALALGVAHAGASPSHADARGATARAEVGAGAGAGASPGRADARGATARAEAGAGADAGASAARVHARASAGHVHARASTARVSAGHARPVPAPSRGPVAHAAELSAPSDPGFGLQWNFWGPFGINLPDAWRLAAQRGAPGGRGAVVAVLDTGVAYRDLGPYRRTPDADRFVPGHDFVEHDDQPLDENGHGTHVAGTIAESTDNAIGAAGIAYEAKIMPVRVLDRNGDGDADTISRGIRYAVRHGADVINLSLEFGPSVRAARLGNVLSAVRYAREHGTVITAVAGNDNQSRAPYPAAAPGVISVAATTDDGCKAEYSNWGTDIDLVAPGGGRDAAPGDNPWDRDHCRPDHAGRSIYQLTFTAGPGTFGLPSGYYGTSMAAPHVAGVAALVIASGRLGPDPTPNAVTDLLETTARDLGAPGADPRYGHGLLDAAAALR
jgi:serine protease